MKAMWPAFDEFAAIARFATYDTDIRKPDVRTCSYPDGGGECYGHSTGGGLFVGEPLGNLAF
jgi:hypothetical protein